MSKKIVLILILISLIIFPVLSQTGSYTTNGYFYLPEYGSGGIDEYNEYNAYMQIADTQIEANKDGLDLRYLKTDTDTQGEMETIWGVTLTNDSENEAIVRTTGDVTNNTTTFATITGLSFSMLANKDYIIEAWIIFQSDTTGTGIKFALYSAAASPVAVVMNAHIPIALTLYASSNMLSSRAYDTGTPSISVDSANANLLCKIDGLVRNGVNAGTLTIRFAAETTGIVKVMTGSVLRYRQVN